ncbi:MAG: hypothetical protein QW045_02735 [Candidatus Micrarchaeaceae archaeon]
MKKANIYITIASIAILIAAIAIYAGLGSSSNKVFIVNATAAQQPQNVSQAPSYFAVQLTDPATVPNGTQALYVSYSNVEMHRYNMPNSTGFVSLNSSGSINLLNLTNSSSTIAVAPANANDIFDAVRLNITHAYLRIGNNTFNVSIPLRSIYVKLNGMLNSNSPVALLDFSPTVLELYSSNNTTFSLLPSVKGFAMAQQIRHPNIGERTELSQEARFQINNSTPNIKIKSASIENVSGHPTISITVENAGREAVIIRHIFIYGYMKYNLSFGSNGRMMPYNAANSGNMTVKPIIANGFKSNFTINITEIERHDSNMINANIRNATIAMKSNFSSICASYNISCTKGMQSIYNHSLESMVSNSSEVLRNMPGFFNQSNSSLKSEIQERLHEKIVENMREVARFDEKFHNTLNFIVESNGTLALPFATAVPNKFGELNGFSLNPNSTYTFTYSGALSIGPNKIILLANQTYFVVVQGQEGAHASANITT